MNVFREELRRKYPGKGRACDHGNSRAAAIWLFCVECQGGSLSAVGKCDVRDCPLWQFRAKKDTHLPVTLPEGVYDELTEHYPKDVQGRLGD